MKKYSVKYYHLDTGMAGSFAYSHTYGAVETETPENAISYIVDKELPQGEYSDSERDEFRACLSAEEAAPVDQYSRHEVMDRASIVLNLLSELLEDHPGMDEELNEHLVKSIGALYDLYQCAGNKFFDGECE